MNRTYWTIAIHLLCGVSFLALPYIFAPKGFAQMAEISHNPHEQTNLLAYLFMLGFFYLNYYVLIPKLYFAKKYVFYAGSTLLCFGVVVFMLVSVDRHDLIPKYTAPAGPPPSELKTAHHLPPKLTPNTCKRPHLYQEPRKKNRLLALS